jgi:high-affinity Fe2+/Pb2+ permease
MSDVAAGIVIALIVAALFCGIGWMLHSEEKTCSRVCAPNEGQVSVNTRGSDLCYCSVDGELKLKKVFR